MRGGGLVSQQSQYLIKVLDDLQRIGHRLKELSDRRKANKNSPDSRKIFKLIQYYQVKKVDFEIYDYFSNKDWAKLVAEFWKRSETFNQKAKS